MLDLDAIADVVAGAVREATSPLIERIAALEAREPVQPEKGEPGPKGDDCDMDEVSRQIDEKVAAAVASLPLPKDGDRGPKGDDCDMDEVSRQIEEKVVAAVAALPPAEAGRNGRDVENIEVTQDGAIVEFAFTVDGERTAYVIELPAGPPGRLEGVCAWSDQVHYQGDIRTHAGATWQALRDTAKEPPHEDWHCIAAAGEDGRNGRSFTVRELFDPEAEYLAMDVVALNGASFVAKHDDPGPCPGDGWQLMAQQGKRGEKGERGHRGEPGARGPAGSPVVAAGIDGEGLLTLVNGDGSTVECDFYPVLEKISRASGRK